MKTIKIKQATIFGFGKWVDYTLTFSTDTLNCIYGYNESGKSTMQQFILFMLFGFPPKKRQLYRPKTSGKMGGRLIIRDEKYGTYTIERIDDEKNGAATCYLSDGQIKDNVWLKERLRGMRSSSYEAIYLFSALELHDIKTMKDTDIGDVLLGIGLTGAHNIYEIEKGLDQNIGALFKPQGTRPIINQQLDTLEKTHHALLDSQKQQATYQDQFMRVTNMEQEMANLQSALENERLLYQQVQKQLDMLPAIMEYHQHCTKHADFPNNLTFPENGLERLEKLNEQLLPLQSEYAVLQNNLQKNEQALEEIKNKQFSTERLEEVNKVCSKVNKYENDKQTYLKLTEEKKQLETTLKTEMTHLSIKLAPDILSNLSLPFYTEKNWQSIEKEITQLAYEHEQIEQLDIENKRKKDALQHDIEKIEKELLSDENGHTLRQTIQTYEENTMEIKLRLQTEANEQQLTQQTIKRQKKQLLILVSSLLLALLTGLSGLILEETFLYVVMIIIGVIGVIQWFAEHQIIKETGQLLEAEKGGTKLSPHVSTDERREADRLLKEHEAYVNELTELKTQMKTCDIQQLQGAEKLKLINQRADRLNERVRTQIESYPFLEEIEPVYWPDLFQPLKRLVRLQQDVQIISEKLKSITEIKAVFEKQTNMLIKDIDNDLANHSILRQIDRLESIFSEQRQLRQQMMQIKQLNEEMNETQKTLQQKMGVYESEKQKLFKAAHVDKDDAFYNIAKQKQDYEANKSALKHLMNQLKASLPNHIYEQIIIDPPTERALTLSYETYKAHIQTSEQSLESKRQQLADAKASLKQLESSESYSQLNHRYHFEKEQLEQSAQEWSVQKVAQKILTNTKQAYQEKYLTKAIKLTIDYFKYATDHKYVAIYPPTKNQPFQVEAKDHTRFSVHELSQGTIDLLYISLRLAIGEVMSENHPLPFIIDDAFVHFDPERTHKMVDILKYISKKRQIILFTCKREIIESLSQQHVHVLDDASR